MRSRFTNSETPAELRHLAFEEVDRSYAIGKVIKKGEAQGVRLCEIGGKEIVVKSYDFSGVFAAFRIFIRLSRPHKSLRYSFLFRSHDIPCPAHFLVVAKAGLKSTRAYLLIDYVEGSSLYDLLYLEGDGELSSETAQAVIDSIKSLHSLGLAHGDLHTKNILITNKATVQLIDLDNVRRSRRRQGRDLSRFLDSVENGKQHREILLKKIEEQLPSPRSKG